MCPEIITVRILLFGNTLCGSLDNRNLRRLNEWHPCFISLRLAALGLIKENFIVRFLILSSILLGDVCSDTFVEDVGCLRNIYTQQNPFKKRNTLSLNQNIELTSFLYYRWESTRWYHYISDHTWNNTLKFSSPLNNCSLILFFNSN